MLALLAAKALDAKNKADPINRLFDTVANFMSAPFFFPEDVGKRFLGGLDLPSPEILAFMRRRPKMLPRG